MSSDAWAVMPEKSASGLKASGIPSADSWSARENQRRKVKVGRSTLGQRLVQPRRDGGQLGAVQRALELERSSGRITTIDSWSPMYGISAARHPGPCP